MQLMYGYSPHICFCGVFWLKTRYRLKKRFSARRTAKSKAKA